MVNSASEAQKKQPKIIAVILSLILPGLGQVYQRRRSRGTTIMLLAASAFLAVLWYRQPLWYIPIALFWIWNILDVLLEKPVTMIIPILLWLLVAYGIGIRVTEFKISALFKNQERASAVIQPMLKPRFLEKKYEKIEGWVFYQVPCSDNPPLPDRMNASGIKVSISPACANINEFISVFAEGLWPNEPVTLYWYDTISATSGKWESVADDDGKVTFFFSIPPQALLNSTDPSQPTLHQPTVVQKREQKGYQFTITMKYLFQGIYETIALAFLATVLGAILAIPISFLAARNLMGSNPITLGIYFIVRTILNIFRSIESLIIAIIFVVIVGLGPFPGLLAITIHTIAALGKLYSEVIEGIDTGPIEAIKATGADWTQVVRFAVIPQIVPTFTALTIYRWDINVRSSTIIGFVGGGGIGFFLYQWILLGDYRSLSSAFIAIAVVVIVLDFFSARLRERIR